MAKQETQISEDTWKRKDYLSARQTAANVTSYVFEGKEISSASFIDYAEDIFKWLFQEQTPLAKPVISQVVKTVSIELPTPTLTQNEIITEISNKLSKPVELLKPLILEWVKEKTGKVGYPAKMTSVKLFVDWYENRNKTNP